MSRLWIDIKNSHEPAFFKPFLTRFSDQDYFISSRKYAEIQSLLMQMNIKNEPIGRHYGRNKILKMYGLIARETSLLLKVPDFDLSLSHGSIYAAHVAKIKFKKTISFIDNDRAGFANRMLLPFVDYLITPKTLPVESLIRQGAKEECIIQYDGFKEDIYEASFNPDPDFLHHFPFNEFVTIRPEALKAAYVKEKKSIVPKLLHAFNRENINILYLPRYQTDLDYAKGQKVFIPNAPLKGLDVCHHSRAVLTGSGTFAREAACMGTPAVSFYPEDLLAVDQKMVDEKWMLHSRNVQEIVDYVLSNKKRCSDLARSKRVQSEVFKIFGNILNEIECKKRVR
ncbi:MAG: DUF354 domain-containing protein [Methanothrix sp.]|nr:MAG: DUF354 domain-containing protein [Methanothrix sp.]